MRRMRLSLLLLLLLGVCGDDVRLSRIRTSLAELEATAKELFESGRLLQQLPTLDAALQAAEQRLKTERSNEGQELYFMARLLRGTIHQQGLALDDEAVEKMVNAYTLSNAHFWEDYYSTVDAERFDWYGTWDTDITWDGGGTSSMGSVLRPFLRADAEMLMVGCGRSEMSQQMYREGFQRITNIDISRPLLERLQRKLGEEMPLMSWRWMNASSLLLPDGSMDVVIEKGTLDSLQDNLPLFKAAVREMHRVLRTGEVLISITDADRLSELQSLAPFRCQGFAGQVAHQKRLQLYVCHKSVSLWDELTSWFKLEL